MSNCVFATIRPFYSLFIFNDTLIQQWIHHLVGALEHFYFSIQLGTSSSQLTNSYFSEGYCRRKTTNQSEFSIQFHNLLMVAEELRWLVAKSCTTKRMIETLWIMGCLPPINWCRISQPSTVVWFMGFTTVLLMNNIKWTGLRHFAGQARLKPMALWILLLHTTFADETIIQLILVKSPFFLAKPECQIPMTVLWLFGMPCLACLVMTSDFWQKIAR